MEQPEPPSRPLPSLRRPTPGRMPSGRARQILWQGKIFPAFWTIASSLSLIVNLILIAALLLLGKELVCIKSLVSDQLVLDLHNLL